MAKLDVDGKNIDLKNEVKYLNDLIENSTPGNREWARQTKARYLSKAGTTEKELLQSNETKLTNRGEVTKNRNNNSDIDIDQSERAEYSKNKDSSNYQEYSFDASELIPDLDIGNKLKTVGIVAALLLFIFALFK